LLIAVASGFRAASIRPSLYGALKEISRGKVANASPKCHKHRNKRYSPSHFSSNFCAAAGSGSHSRRIHRVINPSWAGAHTLDAPRAVSTHVYIYSRRVTFPNSGACCSLFRLLWQQSFRARFNPGSS
jgi:hypothetical protein